MRESLADRQIRCKKIITLLQKKYPEAHCSLYYNNPFELLIATILSAQCTDERVNQVTPILFQRYTNVVGMAQAELKELEQIIRSTGFFHNKAKNIIACAKAIIAHHANEVPKSMTELHDLPGVGRKTANVVLGNAFQIPGMVVDTHVMRISQRLGLTRFTTPESIEKDLEKIVEKKNWITFSHWLIHHGRAICTARSPKCEKCFLIKYCPQKNI